MVRQLGAARRSEAGARELDSYDERWYAAKMEHWQSAINQYLETGTIVGAAKWE